MNILMQKDNFAVHNRKFNLYNNYLDHRSGRTRTQGRDASRRHHLGRGGQGCRTS
jgi:hypothetical protein